MYKSTTQKLALNSVALVARSLVSVGAIAFAARTLAPDQFYLITTGLIIGIITQTLAEWGFNFTIYREHCSSRLAHDHNLISGKLLLSALIGLSSGAILLYIDIENKALFFFFILGGLLQSHLNLLYLMSRAKDRFAFEAIWQLFQCLIFLIGLLWISGSPTPLEIALNLMMPRLIATILSIPYFVKISFSAIPSQVHVIDRISSIRIGFSRVSAMGLFLALASANMYVDNLVVAQYLSAFELGLYQAHVRLMLTLMTAFEVIGVIIQNNLLRCYDRKEKFKHDSDNYLWVLAGLLVAFLCPLSFWYEDFLVLVLGDDFAVLSQYFPYLAVVFYLRVLGNIFGLPISFEAGWQRVAILFSSISFSVLLSITLVPKYGIEGALLVAVASHAFLNLSYLFFSFDFLDKKRGLVLIIAPLIWLLFLI